MSEGVPQTHVFAAQGFDHAVHQDHARPELAEERDEDRRNTVPDLERRDDRHPGHQRQRGERAQVPEIDADAGLQYVLYREVLHVAHVVLFFLAPVASRPGGRPARGFRLGAS